MITKRLSIGSARRLLLHRQHERRTIPRQRGNEPVEVAARAFLLRREDVLDRALHDIATPECRRTIHGSETGATAVALRERLPGGPLDTSSSYSAITASA